MKRLFISQPMNGISEREILETREHLHKIAEKILGEKLVLIDSYIEEYPPSHYNVPVWYLGKSIELLSTADVLIMGKGWEGARGCRIERDIAREYGIDTIVEM